VKTEIFELIDRTEDEVYYTLGLFTSLEEAIKELDKVKTPEDLGSEGYFEDSAKVEIRQCQIGWCGHGKLVFQREYHITIYDDDKSKDIWDIKSEKRFERNPAKKVEIVDQGEVC